MASTANISAVTTANTFDNWRIQTNLDTADINEVCRGDFYKPTGSINVAIGYIEISNSTSGFVALRIPYGDASISSGKMTAKKIDQIGSDGFIYAAATDIRYTSDALNFHSMGNTRTVRLFSNVTATLANVNAAGFIETAGIHSNNGVILNVANYLTVANTIHLGNVAITSNLSVSKNAAIAGAANVGSTLGVVGNTFLYANLAVSKNATITGNVSIGSRANIVGSLNVGSTLETRGNTSLYSNLSVFQNTSISGNVSIGSRANIVGTVNIGSTLEVTGNTLLYSNLTVSRNATVSSNLNVGQNTSITGNIAVNSFADIGGNLTVGGVTTLQTFHVMEAVVNNNIGLAGTRAIYRFRTDTYRSGKLLIEVESADGGNVQMSEAVVTCNTTQAHTTVYATVSTPPAAAEGSSLIGTFSSAVVSGNAEIYLTTTFNNCKTKVVADLIK